jgi:hypothetical protein
VGCGALVACAFQSPIATNLTETLPFRGKAAPCPTLTRSQAADYIREHLNVPCTASTLAQHATDGTGPVYTRVGNTTLYEPEDIHQWHKERAKKMRAAREVPWHKKRGPRAITGASKSMRKSRMLVNAD